MMSAFVPKRPMGALTDMAFLEILVSLVVILAAAEVFTNALEHLGARMKLSEGVTGSLFAAVGTALPETMIPLLSIFAGTSDQTVNQEIGVGAILGAPLMLSTLAMFLMLIAVLPKRGASGEFSPELSGITRDLNTFLIVFALAGLALFLPQDTPTLRLIVSAALILIYIVYIVLTLRASSTLVEAGHDTEADRRLFANFVGLPGNLAVIALQIALGLALLVGGAEGFIHGVQQASSLLGISALVLSLLVVPIATELPEKINSVIWIRRGRDTLAFGNVSGAMVFQGALLPAIGITLTPWAPHPHVLVGVVITLIAAAWLRLALIGGSLKVWQLGLNGLLYAAYLIFALYY